MKTNDFIYRSFLAIGYTNNNPITLLKKMEGGIPRVSTRVNNNPTLNIKTILHINKNQRKILTYIQTRKKYLSNAL